MKKMKKNRKVFEKSKIKNKDQKNMITLKKLKIIDLWFF